MPTFHDRRSAAYVDLSGDTTEGFFLSSIPGSASADYTTKNQMLNDLALSGGEPQSRSLRSTPVDQTVSVVNMR